jgi:peptidyl-prolyl cis-trans isomerase B (cyclophilin B)
MKKRLLVLTLSLAVVMTSVSLAQTKAASAKKTTLTENKSTTHKLVVAATVKKVKDTTTKVKITTSKGIIVVKLYDETPKHRDNFIKLVKQGFYDSLLFHRVISQFMIQGGDPMSRNAQPGEMLGMGGGDMERIPAEFNSKLIHKKGALAAARDGNPEKASSACQFYIVQGRVSSDDELNSIEQQNGIKYTPAQKAIYKTVGGTPFLDMNYTVYGEVISGMEVIDKIAAVKKGANDRPEEDVKMKMEIIK